MGQASRRSWRIGQTEPVKVALVTYRDTLQADALTPVAKKLQSSLAVEGKLPEDGPRRLRRRPHARAGPEKDTDSVESVFEQARQVAAAAEALLVDEDWHAPEPAIIEADAVCGRRCPRRSP
ncbi:MAG: hypothetical protein F4X89_04545 [Dehalococcoidia bacterium]|nr:hypothetical protein [Dehalococcoidia bacterium]